MALRHSIRPLMYLPAPVVVFALLICPVLPATGQEQPGPASVAPESDAVKLTLTAGEQVLWISRGWQDPNERTRLHAFAYLAKGAPKLQPLVIAPQMGEIRRTAVVGQGLHVFLATGPEPRDVIHQRYTPQGPRRQVRLPGFEVPVALAGGMLEERPMLWAIVTRGTHASITSEWQKHQRAAETQPDDAALPAKTTSNGDNATDEPAAQFQKADGWAFVLYDGRYWQPGPLLPEACRDVDVFLLCIADKGVVHLFWKDPEDQRRFHHVRFADKSWSGASSFEMAAEPQAMLAAIMNRQLILAALVPGDQPERYRCQTYVLPTDPSDGTITGPQWLMADRDTPLSVGREARMAAFGDNLALLYLHDEAVQLGLWSPSTGEIVKSAETVVIRSYNLESPSQRGLKDFALTLIVAALVLLLFWRRQESISQPVALPPGLLIAGVGKRFLAALMDMGPALAISLFFWIDKITPYFDTLLESTRMTQPMDPNTIARPAALLWWWVTFRVIYILHCTLFEALSATTPGKRLLGCRVMTENADRANIVQIIIRNVTRYLELEPGISLFLLVIFFTRNRQRIGDLLAKTIVVDGRHIPMAEPVEMEEHPADAGSADPDGHSSDEHDSSRTPPET